MAPNGSDTNINRDPMLPVAPIPPACMVLILRRGAHLVLMMLNTFDGRHRRPAFYTVVWHLPYVMAHLELAPYVSGREASTI